MLVMPKSLPHSVLTEALREAASQTCTRRGNWSPERISAAHAAPLYVAEALTRTSLGGSVSSACYTTSIGEVKGASKQHNAKEKTAGRHPPSV
jgi:hypothetical protein